MSRAARILLVLIPIAGLIGGALAGPFLAGFHYKVKSAALVWQEQGKPANSNEVLAFRSTGEPQEKFFAEAGHTERRFVWAGALFGLWCGMVVSFKIIGLSRFARREDFEIDHAECVSCTRCFHACPQERARLKTLSEIIMPKGHGG